MITALTALSSLRLVLHVLAYRTSPQRAVIEEDLDVWAAEHGVTGSHTRMLLHLLTWQREYRNLFYYRVKPYHHVLKRLASPLPTLYLTAKEIGPGLFIQHGDSSRINGERIGAHCWINHGVTIGYSNRTDRPVLGDRVRVGPGAKVIGKVTVGEDSVVAPNAVVVKDVPPRCTVVGVYPAYVVRQDGERVTRKL